jgi:hypothetical protein
LYRQREHKDNTKVYKPPYLILGMARYREVKKYAGMLVIKLSPADEKDLNLKLGDLIDIEDAVVKTSISKSMAKQLKVKTK